MTIINFNDIGIKIGGEPICHSCEYLNENFTCKAYPNGIPKSIIKNKYIHIKPLKGDNGIQFKLKEGLDISKHPTYRLKMKDLYYVYPK
jgi:hypothetical protein